MIWPKIVVAFLSFVLYNELIKGSHPLHTGKMRGVNTMKTVTLILDIAHILMSAAMLVLMPTAWCDAPLEMEVC